MAKGKGKFEQLWRREAGKFKAKEELRRATARASKRRGTEGERSAVKWRNIRKEAQQKRAPVQKVQARGIGAFLGRQTIGFDKQYETVLLQRGGRRVEPPKHWTPAQVELQEQRDLVVMSRAKGTWKAYDRWWGLFDTFVTARGGNTSEWKRECEEDEWEMVQLVRAMTNAMRDKYAYGTVNMMVSAVARSAKDFGWGNLREDEVLAAMLKGLANLKGVSKKKKIAILGEHLGAFLRMSKPPGMCLELWHLTQAVVVIGWMAFLRVSEILGSGYTAKGEVKDGPPGLDVCDVNIVEREGERRRLELTVRRAKNDQTGEGEVTVVYADEQSEVVCPVAKLKQWMTSARLARQKGCSKGSQGCEECGRMRCVCDCKVCGKLFRNVIHGKVKERALSRTGLGKMLKGMYQRLEEEGLVPEGTAAGVSGISLRAGGVTEAAANGISKEILAGHGRWRSNSGPEHYDRNDKRKYEHVSSALQLAVSAGVKKRKGQNSPSVQGTTCNANTLEVGEKEIRKGPGKAKSKQPKKARTVQA